MPQQKYDFQEAKIKPTTSKILKRRKGNAVFGHRSRKHMRSLTSQDKTVGVYCFENPCSARCKRERHQTAKRLWYSELYLFEATALKRCANYPT